MNLAPECYIDGFAEKGRYERNPYHDPQNFKLTIVDTIERGGGYDFDTTVLLQHDTGTFWIMADSGCSCPTPFEGFDFGSSIDLIASTDALMKYLERTSVSLSEAMDMLRKAKAAGL